MAALIKKATGSKCKACFWAFVSGLCEPLGGLLGWLVLREVLGPATYAIFYGLAAGIMIHISFKKLLPTAPEYDQENTIFPRRNGGDDDLLIAFRYSSQLI